MRDPESSRIWRAIVPILLIGLAVTLLAAGVRSNDEDEAETAARGAAYPDSLLQRLDASFQTVKPIMVTSCYDCHSNKPVYPWYHVIPGVKQLIDDDIREASRHLDLSNDFPFEGRHGLKESLNDIKAEIYEGEMPIFGYLIMHWGTEVTGSRRDSLFSWIDSTLVALDQYDRTAARRAVSDTGADVH